MKILVNPTKLGPNPMVSPATVVAHAAHLSFAASAGPWRSNAAADASHLGRLDHQWIGLRENLHRKPWSFYHQIGWGFRFQFSRYPILW